MREDTVKQQSDLCKQISVCLGAILLCSLLLLALPHVIGAAGGSKQLTEYVLKDGVLRSVAVSKLLVIGSGKVASHREIYHQSKATDTEIQELLSQLHKEFEPWKAGIRLDMVERLYCIPDTIATIRIQIIGGKPYVVGAEAAYETRNRAVLLQIMDLVAATKVPDVDFIVSTTDDCRDWGPKPVEEHGNHTDCSRNAPLFSFCRKKHENACVRMPDSAFGGWPEAYMPDWRRTREWMLIAADRTPFQNRTSTLFWRGAFTNMERKIIAESQAVQESGLADIHMIGWGTDTFREEWVSLPQHCKKRLRSLLLCGSPVIFPADGDEEPSEFWYHMLKDRENIMFTDPVSNDNLGSNVIDVARELTLNESLAERVGKQGQHLAAEILHPENIQRYWLELLTQYGRLMTFAPTLHPDALPMEEALMGPERTVFNVDRTCNICQDLQPSTADA